MFDIKQNNEVPLLLAPSIVMQIIIFFESFFHSTETARASIASDLHSPYGDPDQAFL
jgi:hypothetical protein